MFLEAVIVKLEQSSQGQAGTRFVMCSKFYMCHLAQENLYGFLWKRVQEKWLSSKWVLV